MSQHLLNFAKDHLANKPDEYLVLLWSLYKGNRSKHRYTDVIKDQISAVGIGILDVPFQKFARRCKRLLDARGELATTASQSLGVLDRIAIKEFRGFGSFQSDDEGTILKFSRRKNIFYAPNGGGKTSLCEALEYATTGHIKEADRRKTKLSTYVSRGKARPRVNLVGRDDRKIKPNLQFANCFIDRNRLQEFSLLGSKDSGSSEVDVIAALFGLEDVQEVIDRFVHPTSFSLVALSKANTSRSREAIDAEIEHSKKARSIAKREIDECNSQACGLFNLRIEEKDSVRSRYDRLKRLHKEKRSVLTSLATAQRPVTMQPRRLFASVRLALWALHQDIVIEQELLAHAKEADYHALYSAVQKIATTNSHPHQCPACATPLDRVTEDPYAKASHGLKSLSFLENLSSLREKSRDRIQKIAHFICELIAAVKTNEASSVICDVDIRSVEEAGKRFQLATGDRFDNARFLLQEFSAISNSSQEPLGTYLDACSRASQKANEANSKAAIIQKTIDAIETTFELFSNCCALKRRAEETFSAEGHRIAGLISQRRTISATQSREAKFNQLLVGVTSQYKEFHQDLIDYKLKLEGDRIGGIEGAAAIYYQAINKFDEPHEKIDSIKFEKTTSGYRIALLRNGERFDAFKILSEGHLRALGLALLLAVARKNNFGLIVFDDVVNAIDSDHRANIIDLCFSDPYLGKAQMIITTHDRLFWERFCNTASHRTDADMFSSAILTCTNLGILTIDYAGGFAKKIANALELFDVRQALLYCRIWFETMALDYCIENKLEITGIFSQAQRKQRNFLEVSIERMFLQVEAATEFDPTNIANIKRDLINWGGQNQAHHAFDDHTFNFSHSKTSDEVLKIFNAISKLEIQLFPVAQRKILGDAIQECSDTIDKLNRRTLQLAAAPVEVRMRHSSQIEFQTAAMVRFKEQLTYADQCDKLREEYQRGTPMSR